MTERMTCVASRPRRPSIPRDVSRQIASSLLLSQRPVKTYEQHDDDIDWSHSYACLRSIASPISRSTSSDSGIPLAAHSIGYMLIDVNPGIVFTSFR